MSITVMLPPIALWNVRKAISRHFFPFKMKSLCKTLRGVLLRRAVPREVVKLV